MSLPDHYAVLGLSRDCTVSDIKKSYRKLALVYHPDKSDGDADKFKEVLEAYNTLSDEAQRRDYDTKFFGSGNGSGLSGLFTRTNPPGGRTRFRGSTQGFYYKKEEDYNSQSSPRKPSGGQKAQSSSSRNSKKDAFFSTYRPGFYQYYSRGYTSNSGSGGKQRFYSSSYSKTYWPHDRKTTEQKPGSTSREDMNYHKSTASEFSKEHERPKGSGSTSFNIPRREKPRKTRSEVLSESDSDLSDGNTPQSGRRYFTQDTNYKRAWEEGYNRYRDSSAKVEELDSDSSLEEVDSQQFHSPENAPEETEQGSENSSGNDSTFTTAEGQADNNDQSYPPKHAGHQEARDDDIFVDLTAEDNATESEIPYEEPPEPNYEDFNNESEMHNDTDQQYDDSAYEDHSRRRKRTPYVEEEEEETPTSPIGSPKKKFRSNDSRQASAPPTDDYHNLHEFVNVAPFTQTNGNFNMDGIYNSIGGQKRRQTPTVGEDGEAHRGFVDKSSKTSKVDTTFTPVNTSRPKTFQFQNDQAPPPLGPQLYPQQPQPPRTRSYESQLPEGLVDMHCNRLVFSIDPPIPPQAPNTTDLNELNRYSGRIESYQKQWDEYTTKIMAYHSERHEADTYNGLSYFLTSNHTKTYLQALQQDLKVRIQWQNALSTHIAVMNEYVRCREYLESYYNT